jgi:hypothetical protein
MLASDRVHLFHFIRNNIAFAVAPNHTLFFHAHLDGLPLDHGFSRQTLILGRLAGGSAF